MPGVVAAMSERSTSEASGTERVWTSRIFSRPVTSGGLTVTRRSKRPGRSSALVEDVGPVGGGEDDDALRAGEAVHLGEDLVERLLALVVAEPLAFISNQELFGRLADDDRFTVPYLAALDSLHQKGSRATLHMLVD